MDKYKYKNRNNVGLGKTKRIRKYRVDILGNWYPCEEEKFTKYC